MKIKIENKIIGEESDVFYIAEAGVNHNGSIKIAKNLWTLQKKVVQMQLNFNHL